MITRTMVLLSVLAGIIAASVIVLPLPLRLRGEAPTLSPATSDAPPMPPPPPCIREHCYERPVRLRCTLEWTYRCDRYDIDYEAKCDCIEWGARPADGGAR